MEPASVYKGKTFARFQKKARLTDADLWKAIQDAERGLIDADLGGGVIKQRIARAGKGKSGGSRSIILFQHGNRAIFIHGYEKKTQADLKPNEVEIFKNLLLYFSVIPMRRWQSVSRMERFL